MSTKSRYRHHSDTLLVCDDCSTRSTPIVIPIGEAIEHDRMHDATSVSMFVGEDGATVIQIDTAEDVRHVRVNLNEAPVFDGDPEIEQS